MNVGVHMCRGNFKDGQFYIQGGYEEIATKLFNNLNVNCYYLEYDSERAGSFEPLRFLPKDKFLVLGLVTTKDPQLEEPENLHARVLQAAEVIANGETKRPFEDALAQLCISPQCGFSSHAEGNAKVTHEVSS